VLFAAFQRDRFYRQAQARWWELARTARTAVVLADFGGSDTAQRDRGVIRVHLPEEAPMRREWSLVCDAPDHAAALAAWELPGQVDVPDRDRVFECLWTLDPREVRDAALACAHLVDVLRPGDGTDWSPLDVAASSASPDLREATTLFHRTLAQLDQMCEQGRPRQAGPTV
jgi:DICT domain-containing protein